MCNELECPYKERDRVIAQLKRDGYRAVKVRVTPLEGGAK